MRIKAKVQLSSELIRQIKRYYTSMREGTISEDKFKKHPLRKRKEIY